MSGEIKHEWTGSVLTIISDAGTSSADLQGPKGDTGPRGPQGPAGLLLDEHGEVKVDLSKYYTADEVDAKLENVDLTGYATEEFVKVMVDNSQPNLTEYATKNYVSTEIAKAQLSGGGSGDVDLSGYATKDDLNNYATKAELDNYVTSEELVKVSIAIDNKTIKQAGDGSLCTAIGGGEYISGNLAFTSEAKNWVLDSPSTGGMSTDGADFRIGNSTYDFEGSGKQYLVVINWADGTQTQEWHKNYDNSTGDSMTYQTGGKDSRVYVYHQTTTTVYYYRKGLTDASQIIDLSIYDGEIETVIETIKPQFIPVDGTTIIVNNDGKLTVVGGGSGEDTPVDLSNYYTKAEVDANYYTKAQVDAIALNGTVDLGGYYTKSEIDALLAQIEVYPSAEEVEY